MARPVAGVDAQGNVAPPRCRLGIPRGTFVDAIGYERSSAGEKYVE